MWEKVWLCFNGRNIHNIRNFEGKFCFEKGFGVLWETLLMICLDHCFFFVQFLELQCVHVMHCVRMCWIHCFVQLPKFYVWGYVSSDLDQKQFHESWGLVLKLLELPQRWLVGSLRMKLERVDPLWHIV